MGTLRLAEATEIVRGAVSKAEEVDIRISVAVCDAGGRLVAFSRMDGAIWAGAFGAHGKAVASAGFGRPTSELEERADTAVVRGIVAAEGGHMIPGKGGVPIIRGGLIAGGCGVGGGTGEQDEECARAGVEWILGSESSSGGRR